MASGFLPRVLSFLPPETAHTLTLGALRATRRLPCATPTAHSVPIHLAGLSLPNRVGLAAGFDKNAIAIEGLARLGFGFLEVGTVTPRPQSGNRRPRVFRMPRQRAVVNRLGFPNDGSAIVAARLGRRRFTDVLGVNIGKNATTPNERAVDDYLACFDALHAVADYLVINVSSPNTSQLRTLQEADRLRVILEALLEARTRVQRNSGRPLPLFLKVSPDLQVAEVTAIAAVIRELRWDGIIATNTTVRRPLTSTDSKVVETGGLSGPPLFPFALETVRQLRGLLPNTVIIGSGGIQSAADAIEMRNAGADLVQLYTALIYRGAQLVTQIASALQADDTAAEVSRSPVAGQHG